MRALILAGGEVNDISQLNNAIKSADIIIAADSGFEHLITTGVYPDIFIGDMDSVKVDVKAENIIKLNVMKDETDTEAAVKLAISKGYDDILIFGGLGSRADHSIANILLLKMIYESGCSGCVVNEHNEIYYMEKEISLCGNIGDIVSVIPIKNLENVYTEGLMYKLCGETLKFGESRGVSNVLSDVKCNIKASGGCALVFKSRD